MPEVRSVAGETRGFRGGFEVGVDSCPGIGSGGFIGPAVFKQEMHRLWRTPRRGSALLHRLRDAGCLNRYALRRPLEPARTEHA
jgi:hypothetical protein